MILTSGNSQVTATPSVPRKTRSVRNWVQPTDGSPLYPRRQRARPPPPSLLPLEDVGQHGARRGQLTHLAQELGLGILAHQAGGNRHGSGGSLRDGKKDKTHNNNKDQREVKITSVEIDVEMPFAVFFFFFLQSNGSASSSFEVVVGNLIDTVEQLRHFQLPSNCMTGPTKLKSTDVKRLQITRQLSQFCESLTSMAKIRPQFNPWNSYAENKIIQGMKIKNSVGVLPTKGAALHLVHPSWRALVEGVFQVSPSLLKALDCTKLIRYATEGDDREGCTLSCNQWSQFFHQNCVALLKCKVHSCGGVPKLREVQIFKWMHSRKCKIGKDKTCLIESKKKKKTPMTISSEGSSAWL